MNQETANNISLAPWPVMVIRERRYHLGVVELLLIVFLLLALYILGDVALNLNSESSMIFLRSLSEELAINRVHLFHISRYRLGNIVVDVG